MCIVTTKINLVAKLGLSKVGSAIQTVTWKSVPTAIDATTMD